MHLSYFPYSVCGSLPHCCCSELFNPEQLSEACRRKDFLRFFCLFCLLVGTFLAWKVMSWEKGALLGALLTGVHWRVSACWKICQVPQQQGSQRGWPCSCSWVFWPEQVGWASEEKLKEISPLFKKYNNNNNINNIKRQGRLRPYLL